jgi:hypothetical protein
MGDKEVVRRQIEIDIDKRLSKVETYITAREQYEREDRRWIRGLAVGVTLQFFGILAAGFYVALEAGKLIQRLESIDVVQLHDELNDARKDVTKHSEELELIRQEQFRLRGNIDALNIRIETKTEDRFFGKDGDRLEETDKELRARILRLENEKFFNKKQ